MIGGRVFDTSALVAFAEQRSVYAAPSVWTATEEDIVLLLPSTAVSAAWAALHPDDHPVLAVLLGLPISVVDDLDNRRARQVGELAAGHHLVGNLADAHAATCARDRGWSLITAVGHRYHTLTELITLAERRWPEARRPCGPDRVSGT